MSVSHRDFEGAPVPHGFAQLARNLEFLNRHDLFAIYKEFIMAETTLNDVIDSLQATEAQLVPALQALVADDATQRQRADALQAATDALNATGSVTDAAHASTLKGMSTELKTLLASLVAAPPPPPTGTVTTPPTGTGTTPPTGTGTTPSPAPEPVPVPVPVGGVVTEPAPTPSLPV